MFGQFLRRLSGPATAPASPPAKLALAALLVRLARVDGHYAPAERARIDAILAHRYGLSPDEASTLRAEAEAMEAEAGDNVRFTRALKDAVPHEDRESVMEAMWELILSDGHRDEEEAGMMRLLASLLGVSDQDSAHARRKVEARLK